MAQKKPDPKAPEPKAVEAAPTPCPECGAVKGYNPTTGIENRQGHRLGCSHWVQEPPKPIAP